jgi:hypothetical protein
MSPYTTPPHLFHLLNHLPLHIWDPPTAEYHARTSERREDKDERPQTAQWSGISDHGHRHAPQVQE